MPDVHEFIAGATVHYDHEFGLIARFEGKYYGLTPYKGNVVNVLDADDDKVLWRLRLAHDTKSFVAYEGE